MTEALAIDQIQQRLSEKRKERDQLVRRLEVLSAEIKAWDEAWAILSRPAGLARRASAPEEASSSLETRGRKRERQLQPQWVDMLRMIGEQETATLDDMEAYGELMGYNIKRNTLRSQVSIYANHGWLERVAQGEFRLTKLGEAKCGFVKKSEAPIGDAVGASTSVEG